MIIVDAGVLIAHLDASDAHHDLAENLLLGAIHEPLGASPLTLAETLVGPARAGQLERAATALRLLGVRAVGLDDDAPGRLALLQAETGLKLPDCCVLLAAEQSRGTVATFDTRLAAAVRHRGLPVQP